MVYATYETAEKETGAEMCPTIVPGIFTGHAQVNAQISYCSLFSRPLVTIPKVFAKVDSAQLTPRLLSCEFRIKYRNQNLPKHSSLGGRLIFYLSWFCRGVRSGAWAACLRGVQTRPVLISVHYTSLCKTQRNIVSRPAGFSVRANGRRNLPPTFFGNYSDLKRVFMCCHWIKKPKFKGTGSLISACSLIKLLFSNLLLIVSVNNPTHMYLSDLKVEVYFRVTWSRMKEY